MLKDMIRKLRNTTKKNEKIKILEEYKNNDKIIQILFHTYHPHYQYFLKKIEKPIQKGSKSIDNYIDALITLLERLSERQITGNKAIEEVQHFLMQFDDESQDIIINVIQKDLKCGINIKTINKVFPALLPESDFQLAMTYDPDVWYDNIEYWYASPKMDGIRMRYSRINRMPIGRNGKVLNNLNEIAIVLNKIINEFELNFVDGEIYNHSIPFNKIQSIVSRDVNVDEEGKKLLQYYIFACDSKEITNTQEMINKLNEIQEWLNKNNINKIKIVKQEKIENKQEIIFKKLDEMIEKGYEGLMLRHPQIHYVHTRDASLLKVKKFYSADLRIVDMEKGRGINEDRIGALICEGYVEDRKKGLIKVRTKVGSGLDYDLRKELWDNKNYYIGKIIEIKYQDITKAKNKDVASLRFPVFMRLRLDKK